MNNQLTKSKLAVLKIDSSSRYDDSQSRQLTKTILDGITQVNPATEIIERDVAKGLPFIDEEWVTANATPTDQRTAPQQQVLQRSDELVAEVQCADLIVIGAPIYNFGVPATLKAWIDLVARPGVTFRYTKNGPQGLLENKRAIVAVTSGGTRVGSDIDFVSGYLQHYLGFLGIDDVTIVAADGLNSQTEQSIAKALKTIDRFVEDLGIAA